MADVNIRYKGSTIAELSDSGSKTLQTSGKYCEDDISFVYTKPGVRYKYYEVTVSEKVSGNWASLVAADDDIAEHMYDNTFGVAWNCLTAPTAAACTRSGMYTNAPMGWNGADASTNVYGMYVRTGNTGIAGPVKLTNLLTVKTQAAGCIWVDTDGSINFYASSTYPLLEGTYQIVVWW